MSKMAQARLMRAQGAHYITIHRRLGVSLSTLRTWLDPRAAEKSREWCACRCEDDGD